MNSCVNNVMNSAMNGFLLSAPADGMEDDGVIERSAMYQVLAAAFTYEHASFSPFSVSGFSYTDAFDPSVSRQACSLRERAYTEEDQSALFEELMRFYSFFGLKRADHAEMPDHLSVELEFMHYLTYLEHQAAGQPAELVSIRRAQQDFLSRHVLRLVQGISDTLLSEDPGCLDLVEATLNFIRTELGEGPDSGTWCAMTTCCMLAGMEKIRKKSQK